MRSTLLLACMLVLAFAANAQDKEAKMNSKETRLLVDSVSAALKRWYIYPEKAEVISKAIKDNYKTGTYNKLQSRRELADRMQEDIQKAHRDGHMRILYAPGFEQDLLTELPDSLSKKEEEMALSDERSHNFHFIKAEMIPGDIGYLRWDGFVRFTKEARPTCEAAFKFVSNAKVLIIDMRFNGGGNPETVYAMLNYFFDKKLPMNHIIDHRQDTIKNYTDPKATAFKLSMPVYILTGRRTFSGAEDFTYAMKVARRAVIVGDTTGGGAHPTGPVPLGQGFVLNIPMARSYHEVTGTNWEGTGIYPDIYERGSPLEKAQLLIFKERLAKAGSDEEKQEAQGLVTAAENKLALAQNGAVDLSSGQLQKFCGEYKPQPVPGASINNLTVFLKGSSLFRSISFPPDWKLTPISATRFVYDNDDLNRYMEFSLDKEGNPLGLTIYYTDRKFTYDKLK